VSLTVEQLAIGTNHAWFGAGCPPAQLVVAQEAVERIYAGATTRLIANIRLQAVTPSPASSCDPSPLMRTPTGGLTIFADGSSSHAMLQPNAASARRAMRHNLRFFRRPTHFFGVRSSYAKGISYL